MNLTNKSLLTRACTGSKQAWAQLFDLYRPYIKRWLLRFIANHHDADDLCQDVLLTVHRNLANFEHNGNPGAFRSWLRSITCTRARLFLRGRSGKQIALESDLPDGLEELEDPHSELSQLWQKEHDEHVLNAVLQSLGVEFEPTTIKVFVRLTFQGVSVDQLVEETGLTPGAIYIAKSRVLRRLREEAAGLC